MKIAIIGAGFTGLTAAYELGKKGHQVTIFEKDHFAGGLASGIKKVVSDYPKGWKWDLERFYHHWFTNNQNVIELAKKLKIESKLFQKSTTTAILSQNKIYPYDSPLNILRFPNLSLIDKIRGSLVLAFLRFFPDWKPLEKQQAARWLKKWMGDNFFATPWESLLIGKFGNLFDQTNLAWFWSRIRERTKNLMYLEGGYQILIDALTQAIKDNHGDIKYNSKITSISPINNDRWSITADTGSDDFDKVIVTTSPSILPRLIPNLPNDYKELLSKKLKVIGAQVLVLAFDQPLMDKIYWLNINDLDYPFLVVVEHTNLVDPKNFNGNHLVYVGEYLDMNHPHMQMTKEELLTLYAPYLKKIHQQFSNKTMPHLKIYWHFREPFAQPIFPVNHSKDIPDLETPLPNLYLASMSQVYPFDRGTEHAIELGQKVSSLISP